MLDGGVKTTMRAFFAANSGLDPEDKEAVRRLGVGETHRGGGGGWSTWSVRRIR